MAKKKPAKVKVTELPLDKIDTSPARAVRAGVNEEIVEKYRDHYLDGKDLPPIDVFQGPGVCYGGDCLHRVEAKKAAMGQTIPAIVRTFTTDAAALEAAQDHAAGANEEHGYARTKEDKRAAVRSVIGLKRYAEWSDNAIGDLCKVGHVLVRLVREEMTATGRLKGKASAGERDYKPDAHLRAGAVSDGKGGMKRAEPLDVGKALADIGVQFGPATFTASRDQAALGGMTTVGAVIDHYAEPEAGHMPPTPLVARPRELVKDARGRVVPADLEAAFLEARKFVSDVRGTLGEVMAGIQAASAEPWGKALAGTIQSIEIEFKSVREAVRCGVPAVVCPHVNPDGKHAKSGRCGVCHDRGWLTRGTFEQLTDELKRACDERAAGDPETEAA